MKLFAGSASKKLAVRAAKLLGIKLEPSEIVFFQNSERRVTLPNSLSGEDCFIIQSTNKPVADNLLELAFFGNGLSRQKAKKITMVVPYFGLSRQSKAHRPGEAVSAQVAAEIIELYANELTTFDIHDLSTKEYFKIPFKNLSAIPLLATALKEKLSSNVVILSPDAGGVDRANNFGQVFFGNKNFQIAHIDKSRGDKPHSAKITGFTGNLTGKDVIIVDDIVTSGSTLLPAIDLCIKQKAAAISAAIVHADFLTGIADKLQNSALKQIVITDTIDFDEKPYSKMTKISVAPLITSYIEK